MSVYRRRLMMQWEEDDLYIDFVDDEMERLCMSKFVNNGQWRMSKERAEELTDSDVSGLITSKMPINSFDEFRYFTGVRALSNFIRNNEKITSVTLPKTLQRIETYGISHNTNLSVRIESENLTLFEYSFYGINKCTLEESARIAGDNVYLINARQYEVDKNNPYYTMDDGLVYTKDYSVLVAIPNGLNREKLKFHSGITKLTPGKSFLSLFKGKEVIIPDTIKTIPDYSFYGHDTVKTAVFGTGVESYGGYMCNISCTLETVVFKRTTPPAYPMTSYNELFRAGDTPKNLREIFVPDASVQAYKNKFTNVANLIKPLSTYTGELQ